MGSGIFRKYANDATLSKREKKKPKKIGKRPPGVAYDNKSFPNNCQVCRLMVEEINAALDGETKLTEEQLKEKKRRDRRKSKAEKRREKEMPILVAIEELCDKLLLYIPQQDNKEYFRYVKTHDLKEVKSLIKSQQESESAGDEIGREFDLYKHPETNRLMAKCDDILNKQENNLLKWNKNDEKEDLIQYLCKDRVLTIEDSTDCFNETSARDDLWVSAFDAIFEKHPELKNKQEF